MSTTANAFPVEYIYNLVVADEGRLRLRLANAVGGRPSEPDPAPRDQLS